MNKLLRWLAPLCLLLCAQQASAQAVYGTDAAAFVPRVDPSAITIDGMMGEGEPWAEALVLDPTANWSGGWNEGVGPEVDIISTAHVLYAEDSLYLFVTFEDYELYFDPEGGGEWNSDAIIIGIDAQHDTTAMVDESWSGWIGHSPDSIFAVRAWNRGVTIGGDSVLTDVEWLSSVVHVDEEAEVMMLEAVFHVEGLSAGRMIGFNVGGSSAVSSLAGSDNGAAYAFFSWQHNGNPGGDILNNSSSYGTLLAYDVEIITSIEEDYTSEVPTDMRLSQNYPNPFNPTTTIEYQLTQMGHVSLQVFDVLGRRVATLVNDRRQAGTYDVRLDASGLSSGVYVYQLRVDDQVVASRLMMLVK